MSTILRHDDKIFRDAWIEEEAKEGIIIAVRQIKFEADGNVLAKTIRLTLSEFKQLTVLVSVKIGERISW